MGVVYYPWIFTKYALSIIKYLPVIARVRFFSVFLQDDSLSPHTTVTLFTDEDGMNIKTELKFVFGGSRAIETS